MDKEGRSTIDFNILLESSLLGLVGFAGVASVHESEGEPHGVVNAELHHGPEDVVQHGVNHGVSDFVEPGSIEVFDVSE
jgi:hypothetical protein